MVTTTCNADTQANQLYTSLTADAPTPPTVNLSGAQYTYTVDNTSDLYANITGVTLQELTECDVKGNGVFDKLMSSVDAHIAREFKGNRLTGDKYAEVYTSVMVAVLGQSTQFLLQKDKARWDAVTAQMDARIAEIKATEALILLEKSKVDTQKAIFDMQNSGAAYALTKMKIADADINYCLTQSQVDVENYKRDWLLPAELAIKEYQRTEVLPTEVAMNKVRADRILPAEAAVQEFTNRELQPLERDIKSYDLSVSLPIKTAMDNFQLNNMLPVNLGQEQHKLNYLMPAQTNLINEQKEAERGKTLDNRSDAITPITGLIGRQRALLAEQVESERAKTLDTRTDTTTVVGSIGKQKDLYSEQITSFIKDAKHKTAKMYLDGWITQKTLDGALLAPAELQNAAVDSVLASIRATNTLV